MVPELTVFIDTMMLLHYRWIDEIDWPGITDAEQVELVIAPVIFRELDKHKESHKKKRTRERAASATKRLLELLRNGEKPVRDNVTITFLRSEPSQDYQADGLDFAWNDDRLLAHVLERAAEQAGGSVAIASHDSAVQAKAILRGIATLDLPDELLLKVELDEDEKRIRELERENRNLTDRIPKIGIEFGNGDKHIVVQVLASSELLRGEIDRQQALVRQRSSTIPIASPLGIVHRSSVDSHNSAMCKFYEKYDTYLNEHWAFWHRVVPIEIMLRNSGNYPAHDVDVILVLPTSVVAAYDSKGLPKLPEEPTPPKPRGVLGSGSQDWAAAMIAARPEVHIVRAIRDLNNSSVQNVERPVIYEGSPVEVCYHVKRVKHNLDEPLGHLYLEFSSVESAGSFQIGCSVTVGNVPSEIKATLNVKVENVLHLPNVSGG